MAARRSNQRLFQALRTPPPTLSCQTANVWVLLGITANRLVQLSFVADFHNDYAFIFCFRKIKQNWVGNSLELIERSTSSRCNVIKLNRVGRSSIHFLLWLNQKNTCPCVRNISFKFLFKMALVVFCINKK